MQLICTGERAKNKISELNNRYEIKTIAKLKRLCVYSVQVYILCVFYASLYSVQLCILCKASVLWMFVFSADQLCRVLALTHQAHFLPAAQPPSTHTNHYALTKCN